MIMLKHNHQHQITLYFVICLSILKYNSQTKSKVIDLRVKSPTKPNTDLHNGDF